MKPKFNWVGGITAATMLTGLLAACSGAKDGKPSAATGTPAASSTPKASAKETPKEPKKISMMMVYYFAEPPKKDNIMIQKIEEMTNTKLDITWVPNSAYDNKVNATIASGSLPMVFNVQNNKLAPILTGVKSDMFWEVGPYLANYPNLKTLYNEQTTYNASIDGKLYGMPHQRPLGLQMLLYRKDWLDNLGLKVPQTIDDVYQMAKAFTEQDPDKNGKKDTVGFEEFMPSLISPQGFAVVAAWHGAPNGYGVKDGKLFPAFTTDEYLNAMKFYRKLFSEKTMNQDFAAIQQANAWDAIANGKAGMYPAVVAHATIPNWQPLYQSNPNAKLDFVTRIKGPQGERVFASNGFNGMYMFPKSSIKTEAELKDVLDFIDKLSDPKVEQLLVNGIEGRHFKMDNGKPVRTDQKLYDDEVTSVIELLVTNWKPKLMTGSPMDDKVNKTYVDNAAIAVANPTLPLVSQTQIEKGSELDKLINDARVKYIYGELDDAGWQKAIEQWKTSGGNKIIDEYNTEYAKFAKK
ncbi:MAG: extracellular solute-binding protein [Paenibacillaceae bacterium]|nr:extracellular solute-binding protein [Paenibacillaceae bacterium]